MTPSEHDPVLSPASARAYHLGRLPADEAEAIEARYFANRDDFDVIEAAADDLVDEYLDGRLNETDHARARTLLAAPEWRERLRLASALRAVVQEADEEPTEVGATATTIFRRLATWQWASGLLAAAVVFAVVGTVVTRRQLADVSAQLADSRDERDRAMAAAREAAARVDGERTAREALTQRLESLTSVAVMLMPSTRSDLSGVVRVPADAALVRLTAVQDASLPSGILGARFEIRRGDVQVAGGQLALAAINAGDGTFDVQVPAAALAPGEHELRLAVSTQPAQFREFSRHTFFVRR